MHHNLRKADAVFALCSNDLRVAERAMDIFEQGYAPYLIFSGGVGVLTKDVFDKPEAEVFADVARNRGVPEDKMLIENKSTNTGENVDFTRQLLEDRGLSMQSFILVQKPYMERRTYATFKKRWPEPEFIVTSPQISFQDYPTEQLSKELVINIMVGDLQRIRIYPAKGFQIPQEIPAEVEDAYEKLVAEGYTKHLMKE
jgi:uncharacterized SAM-binding protein YcdF (DUF218 family)